MPLTPYLAEPSNWVGYAHTPDNTAHLNAFMSGIGATKHDTLTLGYYKFPDGEHAKVTQWYVPGYKDEKLLTVDDRQRDRGPNIGDKGSSNMYIQDEYNGMLGINYRAYDHRDSIIWLGQFTDMMVRSGYPEQAVGTILSLLHHEHDLGRGEMLPTSAINPMPYFARRPAALLRANVRAAGILATAKHLNTAARKRYMSLTIPVDLLPNLIKDSMPYDYVATLYPRRTNHVGA